MPLFRQPKGIALEHDWDPQKTVLIHNTSAQNILLDLPSGHFRLDAGRSFRMTPEILEVPQVQALVAAGEITVGK